MSSMRERAHLLLQLGEVAFQDLATAVLVGETGFDPAKRLRDRVVLLLEPLEAQADFVEMAEHLSAELGELIVHPVESAIDRGEVAGDFGELTSEEFDEFVMLGRGHGQDLPQVHGPCKRVLTETL